MFNVANWHFCTSVRKYWNNVVVDRNLSHKIVFKGSRKFLCILNSLDIPKTWLLGLCFLFTGIVNICFAMIYLSLLTYFSKIPYLLAFWTICIDRFVLFRDIFLIKKWLFSKKQLNTVQLRKRLDLIFKILQKEATIWRLILNHSSQREGWKEIMWIS